MRKSPSSGVTTVIYELRSELYTSLGVDHNTNMSFAILFTI